jgi:hypothetical protein
VPRPRWLTYRATGGIVATHFDEDDTTLAAFMLRTLEWADPEPSDDPREGIRVLDTFLSSQTDYQILEQVFRCAQRGVRVRLLLAAPQAPFAEARALSLASTPVVRLRQGLTHIAEAAYSSVHLAAPDFEDQTLEHMLAIIRDVAGESVALKFYNDFPSGPLYFVGDLALAGRYSAGLSATRSPWLLIVDDRHHEGDLYDKLNAEFEVIWAASDSDPSGGKQGGLSTAGRRDALEVVLRICRNFQRAVSEIGRASPMSNEGSVV